MSNEVKPIVVIYIPENFDIGSSGKHTAPMDLMQALNGNFGNSDKMQKIEYNDYWADYLWFCFTDYEISTPQFKVFYPKDFTEIQYKELKEMIKTALEKATQKEAT